MAAAVADKAKTPAQLRRRSEMLEAQLAASNADRDRQFSIYRDQMYEAVDFRMRCEQAMRILSGEDQQ